jgi:hypothetical protein
VRALGSHHYDIVRFLSSLCSRNRSSCTIYLLKSFKYHVVISQLMYQQYVISSLLLLVIAAANLSRQSPRVAQRLTLTAHADSGVTKLGLGK